MGEIITKEGTIIMEDQYEPPVAGQSIDTSRKFTKEQVWHYRRRFRNGEKITHLAREAKVSKPCMASAIRGAGTYEGV